MNKNMPPAMKLTEKLATKICRLCLAHTTTYFSLTDNKNTSEMLEALTSMKILITDEISTVMCLKCHLNLNLAYKIQQNMLKAKERFRTQHTIQIKKETFVQEDPETVLPLNVSVVKNELSEIEEELEEPEVNTQVLKKADPHMCDVCGKVFPTRGLVHRHKYCHKKRTCPVCNKTFTAANLRVHIETHGNHTKICDLCGAVLKNTGNLRQHMFYSHNESRHKCKYCDKVFKKKTNKDGHERKEHLKVANFVCDTCGKKFYTSKTLNTHVKMTHLKLRPYVCDFCNSAFSSNFAMKTHRRQHTNETPYRCDICGEGFRQNVSLKAHKKSKHNIVEVASCQCNVCGKGFASKVALYSHQRVH